jgi:xanthine/CO dehydrogenase XdhC/CoxF family maturation factor
MHSPSFSCVRVSPATAEHCALDSFSATISEHEDTGGTPKLSRAEWIGDCVTHDVDPHVDVVIAHHDREYEIELLAADLVVPRFEVGLLLAMDIGSKTHRSSECEKDEDAVWPIHHKISFAT